MAEQIDGLNDKLRRLHDLADNEEEGNADDPDDPEDQRGPWQVLSDQMDAQHDHIEAKYAALSERTGRYSQWEELKSLLALANEKLAVLPPVEDEVEEDERHENGRKGRGMWDGVELPPDDYDKEAVATPSRSDDGDKGASRKYELADTAMRVMYALPVASIHKKLLSAYNEGRFDSLAAWCADARTHKEIYGIKVTDLRTNIASEWPTHYEEYDDALAHSARANIDGVMKAEVVKKPVAMNGAK